MKSMFPKLTKFGSFDPQKPLRPAHPDFMRQRGYESTGGYPFEQAPWMAGPPVPDFMTLGAWNDYAPLDTDLFSTTAGITRDKKRGYYELWNNPNSGIQKSSESFPPIAKNLSGYYSVPDLGGYYSVPDLGFVDCGLGFRGVDKINKIAISGLILGSALLYGAYSFYKSKRGAWS